MSKNSTTDYLSYILFRALGPLVRMLPLGLSLFLGRRLGDLLFCIDVKHRSIAYSNIKKALGAKLQPKELYNLTRISYRVFGQNFIEIFLIPLITKEYIAKYISIEGRQNIEEAFKKGKGVIFLAVHAGSWELSNVICSSLGFPFNFVVREQGYPRLNELLNSYRRLRGCKLIERKNQTRELVEALKRNESIGVTVDQGGKDGMLVKFFGKEASMATGAFRLALKYGSVILPVYQVRIRGSYAKVIIEAPFELKKTDDTEYDLRENLQRLMPVYEKNIKLFPQEFMWTYKIWKYSKERNILILKDEKTGHTRQSEAVAQLASKFLRLSGIKASIDSLEVEFRNDFSRKALTVGSLLSGKYACQGCLKCLERSLSEKTYSSLIERNPDIVLSCGSSLAAINYLMTRENNAKSVVIMRPGILSIKRFNLVIMLRHDKPTPRKNVLITEGALNLISDEYLKIQSEKLNLLQGNYLGLLLGGDAKDFVLSRQTTSKVIKQVKEVSKSLGLDILVSTSRRTSGEIEALVKDEFKGYPRTKLLIIANEQNIPEAVGGILGLSELIVVSPESTSMISEAASSNKYVTVFKEKGLSKKHQRFLDNMQRNKNIYLVEAGELGSKISEILRNKPKIVTLKDKENIGEAIRNLL